MSLSPSQAMVKSLYEYDKIQWTNKHIIYYRYHTNVEVSNVHVCILLWRKKMISHGSPPAMKINR